MAERAYMKDARGEYNTRYRFIHAWGGANAGWRTVEIRVYETGHVVPVTGPEHYNANESAALAAMQRIYLRAADALWGDD